MINFEKLRKLLQKTNIPENMIERGIIGLSTFTQTIENLLNQMKPPENGWNDAQIRFLLLLLSNMDSNNDVDAFRIGEREARLSTPLLDELAGGFAHGIGRSGDIKAPQPKATGGSVINYLTDKLVLFFFKEMGLVNVNAAMTLPLSTGMSIALTIRGLMNREKDILSSEELTKNDIENRNELIIPRMDHKSPLKAIELASMKPIIVESELGRNIIEKNLALSKNDALSKQRERYGEFIKKHGLDAVYVPIEDIESQITAKTFGILSTTSFFPPRAPDYIKEIAKLAKKHNLIHIINNAYGVQSKLLMHEIRRGIDAGRVDAIIQSTDKNFMTPVGGAIVCSPNEEILTYIAKAYAGRGTAAPVLQLFVSMLSLGFKGFKAAIDNQENNRKILEMELKKLAEKLNEQVLDIHNPIACAMTLTTLSKDELEKLGGFLYNLRVTGPRVVIPEEKDFGSSSKNYPYPYVVMNAAIGSKQSDIIGAVKQLGRAFSQIK